MTGEERRTKCAHSWTGRACDTVRQACDEAPGHPYSPVLSGPEDTLGMGGSGDGTFYDPGTSNFQVWANCNWTLRVIK